MWKEQTENKYLLICIGRMPKAPKYSGSHFSVTSQGEKSYIKLSNMDLSACFVLLTISSAFCDTDSNLQIHDFTKEIRLLRDEMMSLRTQMNYEKTARIELDKDLTEMTRRYRKVSIEFDDIQSQFKTMIETERNYTEGTQNTLKGTFM